MWGLAASTFSASLWGGRGPSKVCPASPLGRGRPLDDCGYTKPKDRQSLTSSRRTPRTLLVGGGGDALNSPDAILWPKKPRGPGTRKSRPATCFQGKDAGKIPGPFIFEIKPVLSLLLSWIPLVPGVGVTSMFSGHGWVRQTYSPTHHVAQALGLTGWSLHAGSVHRGWPRTCLRL